VGNHEPLVKDIMAFLDSAPCEAALVVVGHQPLLGWIGAAFSGEAYPIERAELLCLRFANGIRPRRWWRPHRLAVDKPAILRWVLTPRDVSGEAALAELKDKIRGKMEGAKLLGTFSTAVLGFMLNTLIDTMKLQVVGVYQPVLFAAALAFFVYSISRVIMPTTPC
jgi:hypothetical protein